MVLYSFSSKIRVDNTICKNNLKLSLQNMQTNLHFFSLTKPECCPGPVLFVDLDLLVLDFLTSFVDTLSISLGWFSLRLEIRLVEKSQARGAKFVKGERKALLISSARSTVVHSEDSLIFVSRNKQSIEFFLSSIWFTWP